MGQRRGLTSYLLKVFLPDYYRWVKKALPHALIKFQGRLAGFTSPEQAQELVKVSKP